MENQADLFRITRKEKVSIKVFLCILATLWLLPMYSVLKDSLKGGGISNYTYNLTHKINGVVFPMYFINSAIIAIGSSLVVVFIGTLAGFAFSKIKFKGKNIIYNSVLMCLAVSGPVVLVPFFFILKKIGLYNTHWAVILPEATMTLPFAVLMMKNYFDSLPTTLIESAFIDGANLGQIFFKIFLPLAKPAMINLGVLQIMWSFQDFLLPLMYLTKAKLLTATVAVNSLRGLYGVVGQNLGRYNAALVLIGIPSIIIFIFTQKYITGGITSGAIKD